MNRLKIKILGMIAVIVIAIISASALINMQLQKQITGFTKQNALMVAETIKYGIVNAMHSKRIEEVQHMLTDIKSQETIKVVRIFDTSGKILTSSDKGEIGQMVGKDELTALISGGYTNNDMLLGDKSNFGTISLINNSRDCHGCHGSSREILGSWKSALEWTICTASSPI